jgi:hypothetical protein
MCHPIRLSALILLVGVGLFLAAPAPSGADESMRPEMARIAESIKKILTGRDVESIAVGDCASPAGYNANYGPGITDVLTQELQKHKVRVDPKAAYKVQGIFSTGMIKDPAKPNDLLVIKMKFSIFDGTGEELTSLPAGVPPLKAETYKPETVAKVLGMSGTLSPKGDDYTRNENVQKNLRQKVSYDGTRIRCNDKSLYAAEILCKPNVNAPATPRQPHFVNGGTVPFVDIQRGELYEVKLYNYSEYDAAVTLQIDGLSVFTFSEVRNPKTGAPRYSHFIVAPGKDALIRGWHKRNEAPNNFLSFLVTSYGEGASKYAQQPTGKVGVITATFAYAWPKGQNPPADERSAGPTETGFGPPVSAKVVEVQREIGRVREVVSIRYSRDLP